MQTYQAGNKSVAVNAAGVAYIKANGASQTDLFLTSGISVRVDASYATVAADLGTVEIGSGNSAIGVNKSTVSGLTQRDASTTYIHMVGAYDPMVSESLSSVEAKLV